MPSRREHLWSEYFDLNPSTNLFTDFNDQFNFEDMSKQLDDVYTGYEGKIRREANDDIATESENALSRYASSGVTGGSVVEDRLSGISDSINKRKYNVLGDLGMDKSGKLINLMNLANLNKFRNTSAAQNQENTIYGQNFNKINALSNYLNSWENADINRDNQPGFLEDLFSGLSLASQIASIPLGGGSTLGGKIF